MVDALCLSKLSFVCVCVMLVFFFFLSCCLWRYTRVFHARVFVCKNHVWWLKKNSRSTAHTSSFKSSAHPTF